MKTAKKLVVLMVVLAMVFALSVPAFATGTETGYATVRFIVPKSYSLTNANPAVSISGNNSNPDNYSVTTDYYYAESVNVEIVLGTTSMYDLIYGLAYSRGELATTPPKFVSGYDSHPWAGDPGWYITTLSGLGTVPKATNYSNIVGQSYWAGLSWMAYAVSADDIEDFDVTNPDSSFMIDYYTSNVLAEDGYTYFMIYEPSIQIW